MQERVATGGAIARPANDDEEEESEDEDSSDWEDWQNPNYIEEQRKALQEFSAKQVQIKNAHSKKKKKKGKKKKKSAITGGDALDFDNEDEPASQYQQFDDGRSQESLEVQYPGQHLEETKVNHQSMSKTRMGIGEDGSMMDNMHSQFDG